MKRTRHHPVWILTAIALAMFQKGCTAAAQDRFGVFGRDANELPARHVPMSEAGLDRMLFGTAGAEQFRRRLEFSLTSRANDLNQICVLTAMQEKKLLLAGRGDIKRFFDRVHDATRKIHNGSIDQLELQAILLEFQRSTRNARPEIFGERSLFSKCLANTLTRSQFEKFQRVTRERAVAHHRATVTWVVGVMDTTLHLKPEQHKQLEELLLAKTRPPRRFGEYDYYGVMLQVSRLPEKLLRPIVDEKQWDKLSLQLAEAIRLEPTLQDEGFVPDDQVADAATGPRSRPLPAGAQPRS